MEGLAWGTGLGFLPLQPFFVLKDMCQSDQQPSGVMGLGGVSSRICKPYP